MIDLAALSVIPPIIAAILTYIVANKRARIQYAKIVSDMQSKAVEIVSAQEEKMRKEIWNELSVVRSENKALREEMLDLKTKLQVAHELTDIMREEITSLKSALELTKEEAGRSKKRIIELENINDKR